ncbi:rhodanese-like domain-containing protein [Terrihabitans sp. B22-R8]|uniref:rhodanese-like domain-containing protein n=1 Tax=Terrihabitans sp. B22-R8 TaxID=3425128 RepID=UPI00403C16A4
MSTRRVLLLAAALFAASVPAAMAVPEPDGLWSGPMIGETPTTLAGAKVLDLPNLEMLLAEEPLLVDSGPAPRKPDNLSTETLWKPTHRSIPGAVWFPGAGRADLSPEKADALLARIAELTKGNTSHPIVSFCRPNCWGSWNVGKRLVAAGYTAVYWFPAGIDAWQERSETAAVEPQPGWEPN